MNALVCKCAEKKEQPLDDTFLQPVLLLLKTETEDYHVRLSSAMTEEKLKCVVEWSAIERRRRRKKVRGQKMVRSTEKK